MAAWRACQRALLTLTRCRACALSLLSISRHPNNIEQVPLANVKNIDGVWHVKDGDKVYRIGEIREVQE
jgi:uncharacterized protein with PIN domain